MRNLVRMQHLLVSFLVSMTLQTQQHCTDAFVTVGQHTQQTQSSSWITMKTKTKKVTLVGSQIFAESSSTETGAVVGEEKQQQQEGIIKTITKEGRGPQVNLGDIATVKYTCYLPDDDTAYPFSRSEKQKMVVGDGTMIKGWDKALRTMRVGERSIFRVVDPTLGYGSDGVPPIIPSNAPLEFDIEVLDTQLPTTNIDFDSLATADNTPRTAFEIQAAYEQRQAIKQAALQESPAKEGIEGFIEKAKSFYFFGFFEGETGQEAPWYLRPSITFPLAFLVVGAAFYVSIVSGAITERGASVKDELDEIILSSILNTLDDARNSPEDFIRTTGSLIAMLLSSSPDIQV